MNKVVLITGGSRGIGSKTALKFATHGYKVAFTYKSDLAAAKATLGNLSGNGHAYYQLDICSPEGISQVVNDIIAKYGKIDVLVNNAGIFEEHKINEVNFEHWQSSFNSIINTNLIGPANIIYAVAQYMISQKNGYIINVTSRGAFRGEPDFPAYGASKGGMNSLSQSLAKILGKFNISVTAVAPGFVETDMAKSTLESPAGEIIKNESPFKRVAKPEEVANAIYFLAQKESIFLSGGIIDINGASFLRM
jgi:NAD(P)-dependent dehydrogenase (short-subunit alcohol dehydrogenase family)